MDETGRDGMWGRGIGPDHRRRASRRRGSGGGARPWRRGPCGAHDVFGVFRTIFRELDWQMPIFYWRAVPKTPNAS